MALRPPAPADDDPAGAAMAAGTRVEVVIAGGEVLVNGGRALLEAAETIDARAREARERLC